MLIKKNSIYIFFVFLLIFSCKKEEDDLLYLDEVKKIVIDESTTISNGYRINDPNYNFKKYDEFIKHLSSSDRFMLVTQKDFKNVSATNKVIISLRYDIDDNIEEAVRFAYRENKYGIKSTYYVLHTAGYYGVTDVNYFKRNNKVAKYLFKMQNDYGQEIGWHNDLVTIQIVYNLDSRVFLRNELEWLRGNGVNIYGTNSHGSGYCYQYHYVNAYFWNHTIGSSEGNFYNWIYVPKDGKNIVIEKDDLSSYNLTYDGDLNHADIFLTDSGREWYMEKVNFDTIPLGKKVIVLLHPQHWE